MPKRIAFVTNEIPRPDRWAKPSSVLYFLATALAQNHLVHIVLADFGTANQNELSIWPSLYGQKNLELVVPPLDVGRFQGFDCVAQAHSVYRALRDCEYDVINFAEPGGLGYFCFLAQRQGLAFTKKQLTLNLCSQIAEQKLRTSELFQNENEMAIEFLESESHALATTQIDAATIAAELAPARPVVVGPSKVIAYCGRLDDRDHVDMFCAAIEGANLSKSRQRTIFFIGEARKNERESQFSYITQRARAWVTPINIIDSNEKYHALRYIEDKQILAVLMPSLDAPAVAAAQCHHAGVNFIAPNESALREFVNADRLFDQSVVSLGHRLQNALATEAEKRAAPQHLDRWMHLQSAPPQIKSSSALSPLVSVCIVHRDREQFLREALESLERQSYKNFEILVVDTGSQNRERIDALVTSPHKLQVRVLHSAVNSPGYARNIAAQEARGEYLIFMDDDNIAASGEIETFIVAAKNSEADIYTCPYYKFAGDWLAAKKLNRLRLWLPLGPSQPLGLLSNVFGDTNFLIRRDIFLKLGGFSTSVFYGEDWEFLSRAMFAGYRIEVVPEPLFFYRDHGTNLTRDLSLMPTTLRLAPYLRYAPPAMRSLFQVVASQLDVLSGQSAAVSQVEMLPPVRFSELWQGRELHKRLSGQNEVEISISGDTLKMSSHGKDPWISFGLPPKYDGPLSLDIWVNAAADQELRLYWKTKTCLDYLEANSRQAVGTNRVQKISFYIEAGDRVGDLRLDLYGGDTPVQIRSIRVNSYLTRKSYEREKLERARCRDLDDVAAMVGVGFFVNGDRIDGRVQTVDCDLRDTLDGLCITSHSTDPQIHWPRFDRDSGDYVALYYDVVAMASGEMKFYWCDELQMEFDEKRSATVKLTVGRLSGHLFFNSNRPITRLRFDPMDQGGSLIVRQLVACDSTLLEGPVERTFAISKTNASVLPSAAKDRDQDSPAPPP